MNLFSHKLGYQNVKVLEKRIVIWSGTLQRCWNLLPKQSSTSYDVMMEVEYFYFSSSNLSFAITSAWSKPSHKRIKRLGCWTSKVSGVPADINKTLHFAKGLNMPYKLCPSPLKHSQWWMFGIPNLLSTWNGSNMREKDTLQGALKHLSPQKSASPQTTTIQSSSDLPC